MVNIEDRDLYQLLISEFRYSVQRDNHLAPGTCVNLVMRYLPEMSKEWRAHTAHQLTDEIIAERIWGKGKETLEQDAEWEKLLMFLTNYLVSFPLNVERYMTYLYQKPAYTANIDYYAESMTEKIKNNWTKR